MAADPAHGGLIPETHFFAFVRRKAGIGASRRAVRVLPGTGVAIGADTGGGGRCERVGAYAVRLVLVGKEGFRHVTVRVNVAIADAGIPKISLQATT